MYISLVNNNYNIKSFILKKNKKINKCTQSASSDTILFEPVFQTSISYIKL